VVQRELNGKCFSAFKNLPIRMFSCGVVKSNEVMELIVSEKVAGKSLAAAWRTVKSLPRPGCEMWMSEGRYCWRL